ncbi:MAG TPA: cytochrome c [Terriglobia bacterium]|nr:cytochrome c [Terriglobia bacterium]
MKAGLTMAAIILTCLAMFAAELSPKKVIELPADNSMAELKPGPGLKTVQADCGVCHSTDYVVRQPHKSAKDWQAEVTRMITAFGAPIPKSDEGIIAKYLATAYGPQPPQKDHPGPVR